MNVTKPQTVALGIFLIALGAIWALNLWWLVLPGALATAGVIGYLQRRSAGRTIEAVQIGLWGVGLGLLFLLHFVWPGILFLAGASVLLRGREHKAEDQVQRLVSRVTRRRTPASSTSYQVPVTSQEHQIVPITTSSVSSDTPAVGETTRLP